LARETSARKSAWRNASPLAAGVDVQFGGDVEASESGVRERLSTSGTAGRMFRLCERSCGTALSSPLRSRSPWVYSLYSVAQGANYLVTTFFREFPDQPGIGDLGQAFAVGSLTWEVGDRYLTFGALVGGLLEVGVVLAAAAFVYWWRDRDVSPRPLADEVGNDG